jgi:hypothetical protein
MRCLLTILLVITTLSVFAQKAFTEGSITYAVSLGPISDSTSFSEHAGTYTITIKGAQIRKDLQMNTGYKNTILLDASSDLAYSLQQNSGQYYAIQFSVKDILAKQKPFEDYTIQTVPGKMTIASLDAVKSIVSYKDGSRSALYCSTEWLAPQAPVYDRYPGVKNLPLSFEYRTDDGIIMHFQAEKVIAQTIESATFRLPTDYKIITNKQNKERRK